MLLSEHNAKLPFIVGTRQSIFLLSRNLQPLHVPRMRLFISMADMDPTGTGAFREESIVAMTVTWFTSSMLVI